MFQYFEAHTYFGPDAQTRMRSECPRSGRLNRLSEWARRTMKRAAEPGRAIAGLNRDGLRHFSCQRSPSYDRYLSARKMRQRRSVFLPRRSCNIPESARQSARGHLLVLRRSLRSGCQRRCQRTREASRQGGAHANVGQAFGQGVHHTGPAGAGACGGLGLRARGASVVGCDLKSYPRKRPFDGSVGVRNDGVVAALRADQPATVSWSISPHARTAGSTCCSTMPPWRTSTGSKTITDEEWNRDLREESIWCSSSACGVAASETSHGVVVNTASLNDLNELQDALAHWRIRRLKQGLSG